MTQVVSKRFLKRIEQGMFPDYFKLPNGTVAQMVEFDGEYFWDDDGTLKKGLERGFYYKVVNTSQFIGPYATPLDCQVAAFQAQ